MDSSSGGDAGGDTKVEAGVADVDSDAVKVIKLTTTSVSPVPAEISDKVAKFVSGDPISDKQNPFKESSRDETDYLRVVAKGRIVLTGTPKSTNDDNKQTEQNDEDDDVEGDISTEDVLNQSKYVQTYIKNPDKYFTLDTDKIKQIQREERAKPIPLRRRLFNNGQPQSQNKVAKKRWIPNNKYSVYPNLSDIKVRVGAASDPDDVEYYNPAEVKFNAAQFDDRFKTIQEFGSQDDIDTIAEKTESLDGEHSKEREKIISNNLQAEPKNKSYTNTVSSKEFQAYLKAKGLALVPLSLRNGKTAIDSNRPMSVQPQATTKKSTVALRSVSFQSPSPGQNSHTVSVNGKKPSVFHRLLSRNRVQMGTQSVPGATDHHWQLRQMKNQHPSPREPIPMHANPQQWSMNRRTAPPQQSYANYSNSLHDEARQPTIAPVQQRHSTPIKSTTTGVPQPTQRQLGHARDIGVDNNLTNTPSALGPRTSTPTPVVENIYESTDRLQNLRLLSAAGVNVREGERGHTSRGANNGIVVPTVPVNNQVNPIANSNQQILRSMPRHEIYAHLYAFYQKSKRNSVSSETLQSAGRSQSRNSGYYQFHYPSPTTECTSRLLPIDERGWLRKRFPIEHPLN